MTLCFNSQHPVNNFWYLRLIVKLVKYDGDYIVFTFMFIPSPVMHFDVRLDNSGIVYCGIHVSCNYIFQILLGFMIRKTNVESLVSELQLVFFPPFQHYPCDTSKLAVWF